MSIFNQHSELKILWYRAEWNCFLRTLWYIQTWTKLWFIYLSCLQPWQPGRGVTNFSSHCLLKIMNYSILRPSCQSLKALIHDLHEHDPQLIHQLRWDNFAKDIKEGFKVIKLMSQKNFLINLLSMGKLQQTLFSSLWGYCLRTIRRDTKGLNVWLWRWG